MGEILGFHAAKWDTWGVETRQSPRESEGLGGRRAQSAGTKQLGGGRAVEIAQFPGSTPGRGRNFSQSRDSDRVRNTESVTAWSEIDEISWGYSRDTGKISP